MFYHIAPSYIVLLIALILFGIFISHTYVPVVAEIDEVSQQEYGDGSTGQRSEYINGLASGLQISALNLGCVIGPLLGNFLYVSVGFKLLCNWLGIITIVFGIVYNLFCDTLAQCSREGKRSYETLLP